MEETEEVEAGEGKVEDTEYVEEEEEDDARLMSAADESSTIWMHAVFGADAVDEAGKATDVTEEDAAAGALAVEAVAVAPCSGFALELDSDLFDFFASPRS